MNRSFKTLGFTSLAACILSVSAHAATTSYAGNTNTGFGGPVGNGMLTFSNSAGTLTGTVAPGPNNGAGNNGQLYDELVIYISTNGTTGFTSTSTLTDTTTNTAFLAEAVSGYNGSLRSTINFSTGFAANYAIAISPTNTSSGELFSLSSATSFTALQSVNLTPVGGAGNPNYTFSLSLANIGSPGSFKFSTTYLNAHVDGNGSELFRSNEAFNSITDTSNTANTSNPAQDTVTLGVDTFTVPEPGTWAMMLGGIGLLGGFLRRRRVS